MNSKINLEVLEEAVKIHFDYNCSVEEAVGKAKEVIKYEKNYKENRIRSSDKEESLSKYCR